MLTQLPAELLLHILSFLVSSDAHSDESPSRVNTAALNPLSQISPQLAAATYECRAQILRERIAKIDNVDLLMAIWSAPTFFHRRPGEPTAWYVVDKPQDLECILINHKVFVDIERYLASLESRNTIVDRMIAPARALVPFPNESNEPARNKFAAVTIIHLWSVQARYAHDIDGRLEFVTDETIAEEILSDNYSLALPPEEHRCIIALYLALERELRPPFHLNTVRTVSADADPHGMWLYRLIVKDGMEPVWELVKDKMNLTIYAHLHCSKANYVNVYLTDGRP